MRVSSTEARKRWADVLDAVNRAENVVVTRRGTPYAMIVRWRDWTMHDEPWSGHFSLRCRPEAPVHLVAASIGTPLFSSVEPVLENAVGKCVAATTDPDGRMRLHFVVASDVNIAPDREVSYAVDSLGRVVYLYVAPALSGVPK